jgi:hypothetical protein
MAIIRDEFGNKIDNLNRLGGETLNDPRVGTFSLNTVNGEIFFDCDSIASATVDVRGTFSAQFLAEATINGTDYFMLPMLNPLTEVFLTTITTIGTYIINVPNATKRIRIRCSSYTSGTANIALRGSVMGNIVYNKTIPTTTTLTATGALSAATTLTIPSPGTGLFHYITRLRISKYCGGALTASATPSIITTTNILGTPSFDFKTLGALGDSEVLDIDFTANPLKSQNANTATTIVAPVLTNAIWKITAFYYVGA